MTKSTQKKLLTAYIILCLCFIWGQSLLPVEKSSQESGYVLNEVVHPVEERLFGEPHTTEYQVRKAAHVLEYMLLSLGLALYFRMWAEKGKERAFLWIFPAFSTGLFAALVDETIQLFTGRGSLVSDIWVDSIGLAAGIFIVWLIAWIRRRKKNV